MKTTFKSTWPLCMVKRHRKYNVRNVTVPSQEKIFWKRISKACTVRELQRLSVTLARSRFQTPAILKGTWPLPRIQELTNCQKQNARDLQRQLVFQLTSGEFLQVRFFSSCVRKCRICCNDLARLRWSVRLYLFFTRCSDSSTASASTTRSENNGQSASSNR